MSDEKKVQNEKEVKSDGKLEKQVANIAFTVRKIKDKLEEQLGMDIDGDGHIGSGPYKKALIFLLVAGMASFCMAEDKTAIAYWSTHAKIDADGYYSGSGAQLTNVPVGGVSLASNKVLIGSSAGLGSAQTLSGLFAITTGGVASATTSGAAVTNSTATATVTAGLLSVSTNATATVAMTPQAPSAVTPTITVTPETGAVTASGANDLVTPTAVITPQVITVTNYVVPVFEYGTFTNANFDVTNVFSTVTNITWTENVYSLMTNATCAITPDLASNTVVAVTVTGGGAVMTNATAVSSALPLFATNSTGIITVTAQNTTLNYAATNAPAVSVSQQTATFVKP